MSRRNTTDSILKALRSDLLSLRERVMGQAGDLSRLEDENAHLRRENEALRGQLEPEPRERAVLAAKVAALEAELARRKRGRTNSSNSSKPPSSDHPHDPKSEREGPAAKPDQPASGRKPGGQPGHPGAHRRLAPEAEVQDFVVCTPQECQHCSGALHASPADPAPRREQCFELPPITWEITEYVRHGRTCAACGQRTWGARPREAPQGGLGFRAQAAIGLLTGGAQVSRRVALTLLAELTGFSFSLGTLSSVEDTVQAALAPAYAEIRAAVAAAPVVNCDETPWRAQGGKPWLWAVVTPTATLFSIQPRRDKLAYQSLGLDQPEQIKGTDRFAVYTALLAPAEQAVCWGHLDRDFAGWLGHNSVATVIARWLAEETNQLFHEWHAFRNGECDRVELAERLAPVQAGVEAALHWGAESGVPKFQGFCQNLLDRQKSLWTFVSHEGVEPTNNAAERALRQGVLWRKTSLFTQSERGKSYVERVLSVKTTLRKLGGNLLEFLTETLRCHQAGLTPPKLLAPAVT